ncbi:hypothetical protein MMC28_000559 [Mycoblastus sanguinarius]|nr:hypothetical protein [Mycoblastus sanguinarius]
MDNLNQIFDHGNSNNITHNSNQQSAIDQSQSVGMVEEFLDSLPDICKCDLPEEDRQCAVCLQEYCCLYEYLTGPLNEGTSERAVRLPCNHVIGFDCIVEWLSPYKEAKNTCPYCRSEFFPAQEQDEGIDRTILERLYEEEWRQERQRLIEMLEALWPEGEDGVDERDSVPTEVLPEYLEVRSLTGIVFFFQTTAAFQTWRNRTVEKEEQVADYLLYIYFRSNGVDLPPWQLAQTGPGMAEELEEAMVAELDRRGAFTEEGLPASIERAASNHDTWRLLREKRYRYSLRYEHGFWELATESTLSLEVDL